MIANPETVRAMNHLRQEFNERRPIFWELYRMDGAERPITAFGGQRDDGTITLGQLRRLFRCIVTEGYGE